MAEVVIVDSLVAFWRLPFVRQMFPWLFLLISAVGSLLKEQALVPQTYFNNSRNVLNVYFVKVSWGWTLLLLTPFVLLLSSSSSSSSSSSVISTIIKWRLPSLLVATVVWYICTEIFFYFEHLTGSCFEISSINILKEEFTTKESCRQAGFQWRGYDISGHSFILSYSALFIVEEMAPMASVNTASLSALPRMILNLLYVCLNLIIAIWVLMFASTSVYFHDPSHKLLGTLWGLLGWYLTYRVWYLKPSSPGLPSQLSSRSKIRKEF